MKLKRLIRYIIAGGATTGLMLALVYIFTTILTIHYLIATSAAFFITIVASFIVHKYWTFQDKKNVPIRQFGGHFILVLLNFCLNDGLMYVFVNFLYFRPIPSQVLTSGLLACLSFFVYNKRIFKFENN